MLQHAPPPPGPQPGSRTPPQTGAVTTRHRAWHARCQPRHEPGTLIAMVTPSMSTPRRRTPWTPPDDVTPAPQGHPQRRGTPALPWTGQVTALAHRLRAVLEDHPGIAALLKTRDPISPASLALAEAFLAPLHAAGLPGRQAAWAFRLIYDYTVGFALSDPTSPGEQRVQDTATRAELHAFLRSLPASRFPALTALGAYAWADDRDQRFTASLDTLIAGLRTTLRPRTRDAPQPAQTGPARPARPDGPA